MTSIGMNPPATLTRSFAERAAALLILWIMVSGTGLSDFLPGLVAALAGAGISLGLLPPGAVRLRPVALVGLALRLLWQSIIAGADVARRALDPRLPIKPGLVRYPVGLPPGSTRNTFTTLMSLLPGTVPIATNMRDHLVVHCLDVGQPVINQLAAEEALLLRTISRPPGPASW